MIEHQNDDDNVYLRLGFMRNVLEHDERRLCMLRLRTLAADSSKPNKLKRHLESEQYNHVSKPFRFF